MKLFNIKFIFVFIFILLVSEIFIIKQNFELKKKVSSIPYLDSVIIDATTAYTDIYLGNKMEAIHLNQRSLKQNIQNSNTEYVICWILFPENISQNLLNEIEMQSRMLDMTGLSQYCKNIFLTESGYQNQFKSFIRINEVDSLSLLLKKKGLSHKPIVFFIHAKSQFVIYCSIMNITKNNSLFIEKVIAYLKNETE